VKAERQRLDEEWRNLLAALDHHLTDGPDREKRVSEVRAVIALVLRHDRRLARRLRYYTWLLGADRG
jgi:hypothetical protein